MPGPTVDFRALYKALDEKRERRGMSWRQLGLEVDIPSTTFTRLKSGRGVSVHVFVTLLYWLGVDVREPLAPFLSASETSRHI